MGYFGVTFFVLCCVFYRMLTSMPSTMSGVFFLGILAGHLGISIEPRMLQYAQNSGVALITLSVRSDNFRAKALYRKYGFVFCGIWPDYIRIDGQSFDVDLMVKRLVF